MPLPHYNICIFNFQRSVTISGTCACACEIRCGLAKFSERYMGGGMCDLESSGNILLKEEHLNGRWRWKWRRKMLRWWDWVREGGESLSAPSAMESERDRKKAPMKPLCDTVDSILELWHTHTNTHTRGWPNPWTWSDYLKSIYTHTHRPHTHSFHTYICICTLCDNIRVGVCGTCTAFWVVSGCDLNQHYSLLSERQRKVRECD